jgi:hypothetical protein
VLVLVVCYIFIFFLLILLVHLSVVLAYSRLPHSSAALGFSARHSLRAHYPFLPHALACARSRSLICTTNSLVSGRLPMATLYLWSLVAGGFCRGALAPPSLLIILLRKPTMSSITNPKRNEKPCLQLEFLSCDRTSNPSVNLRAEDHRDGYNGTRVVLPSATCLENARRPRCPNRKAALNCCR